MPVMQRPPPRDPALAGPILIAACLALALSACEAEDGGASSDPGGDTGAVTSATGGDGTTETADTGAADVPYGTPKVEIIQPIDGEVLLWGATVILEATVVDADDVLEDLAWELESSIDGVVADGDSGDSWLQVSLNDLSPGTHHITVTVTDPAERVGKDSIDLTLNRPPGDQTVLAITPETPTTAHPLKVLVVEPAIDPDGTSPVYQYTWYVDDAPAGVAADSVSSALTERGQTWRVVGTPSDGHVSGGPAEASVLISNAAPAVASVSLLPSAGNVTSTFNCLPEGWSDADADAEGYHVAWLVDDELLEGVDALTVSGDTFDKGDEIVCVVTPWDGIDEGLPVSSDAAPVLDAPPTIASVDIDPLEGDVTTTFTCTWDGLSDPDPGDDPDIKHIWIVNGEPLPGTTSTSFGASTLVKGDTLRCQVVPFSGPVDGKAVSSKIVTIGNAAPQAGPGLLQPVPATEASGVTCLPGELFDPDDDNLAHEVIWYVDGVVVEGQTGATLSGDHYDKGAEVWCEVVPFDGQSYGAPTKSKVTATIINTPPTLTSVTVTPGEGSKTDTYTCTPAGAADVDPSDSVSFNYAWYMNGAVVPGGIFATLVPSPLGGSLTCVVTPTDGFDPGVPVGSGPALVTNHTPSISGVLLGPEPATEATELTCSPFGWADADSDDPGYLYTWAVNGAPLDDADGPTLDGAAFDKNQLVVCFAAAWDGTDAGPSLPSNTVKIDNSPPWVDAATISPGVGSTGSTFTCDAEGGGDLDAADPLIFAYQWYANGAPIDDADAQAIVPKDFDVPGDAQITCRVTPFDGTIQGAPVMSAPAVLTNLAPVGDAAVILPSLPTTLDDVQCIIVGLADPDGDDVEVTVVWTVNGQPVAGESEVTLDHGHYGKGDKIICVATPSDGTLSGPTLASPPVTVLNSPPTVPDVAVGPANAAGGAALDCAATSFDADEDDLDYTWQWARGGLIQPAYTTNHLPAGVTDDCEEWTCYATVTDGEATPPPGQGSLSLGGGGAGGGDVQWFQHHSYDPVSKPNTNQTNQFFQVEIAATRVQIPVALPVDITSVRVLVAPGTTYTARVYADVNELPGSQLAAQTFTGSGTLQQIDLSSAATTAQAAVWIGLQGSGDFMTVYGDANGQATSNMIYGCDAFLLGECWGEWGWKPFGAFGPPFTSLGDLVISAGVGGGGGAACP